MKQENNELENQEKNKKFKDEEILNACYGDALRLKEKCEEKKNKKFNLMENEIDNLK